MLHIIPRHFFLLTIILALFQRKALGALSSAAIKLLGALSLITWPFNALSNVFYSFGDKKSTILVDSALLRQRGLFAGAE
jgi:hypothetical protein